MRSTRAIARRGVGFGSLAIATRGFVVRNRVAVKIGKIRNVSTPTVDRLLFCTTVTRGAWITFSERAANMTQSERTIEEKSESREFQTGDAERMVFAVGSVREIEANDE